MKFLAACVAVAVAFTCANALGATFTVTNTNNSGAGSLRQAILDANATANVNNVADRISFNIAGAVVHTITPLTQLPDITDPVVIDGFSQPGTVSNTGTTNQPMNAALKIELNGNNVPTSASQPSTGLHFIVGDSTVQGLVINRFTAQIILEKPGNNSRVQGCYLGVDVAGSSAPINTQTGINSDAGVIVKQSSGNLIGATFASGRNLISGNGANVELALTSTGNTIIGNLIGLKANGVEAIGSPQSFGVFTVFGPSGNTIGGTTTASRNVISGHFPSPQSADSAGVYLAAQNDTVLGNFIGTDYTGRVAVSNIIGVAIGGQQNSVGGNAAGSGNLISGNTNEGVRIVGSGNSVTGNLIGTDKNGNAALPNGTDGVFIREQGNFIGGVSAGEANVIAFNHRFGVYVPTLPVQTQPIANIRGNAIFRNDQLGIKLGTTDSTPTANDLGDGDIGGNNLQNHPFVTLASPSGNNLNLAGNLNSTPNTGFRIDLYADTAADPNGSGEGRLYLGTALTSTNSNGDATYTLTVPLPSDMSVVTATATANDGTSEFSPALGISGAPAHLLNISTRLNVQTGDNVLISGFILTGSEQKRVLVRGLGPSLQVNGQPVPGRMSNPLLELYRGSTLGGTNDDWQSTQAAEIQATGIAPTDSKEAAGIVNLDPGSYTAILRGSGGDTGIAVLDAYDLEQTALSKLANVSTRGFVGTGDNVLIGGVILGGGGNGNARVIFRAIGPTLSGAVANPLQDPMLELYNSNGTIFASNDDWKSEQAATESTGIPPTDNRESALVRSLPPGNYTALVRGKNNSTGVGVVEAYNLQ